MAVTEDVVPSLTKVLSSNLYHVLNHIFVRWTESSAMEATWESLEDFVKQYPNVQLEELLVEEGRDEANVPYRCRFGPDKPS